MSVADASRYLNKLIAILNRHWPENRGVNIACHGHSVPAGYFATPMVDSLNAYPHLLHASLKHRYPFAVINVIVTAVGGENSQFGEKRFSTDVMCHRPDVVTIDYGLNDRGIGLAQAEAAWRSMVETALAAGARVILLTPTMDKTQARGYTGEDRDLLPAHAEQIRRLAAEYEIGLADSFAAFRQYCEDGDLIDLLSWSNHPNRTGHEFVVRELLRWFPPTVG